MKTLHLITAVIILLNLLFLNAEAEHDRSSNVTNFGAIGDGVFSDTQQLHSRPLFEGLNITITVAKDGSGDYRTIQEAVNNAPNQSSIRSIIHIKEGIYFENIIVSEAKTNLAFLGDGRAATIISGNRSQSGGYSILTSPTVVVSGNGFVAQDMTFENTAGPENFQAVALRINADSAAVYHCNINGYQDTLFVQSNRQFYRECNISGTIDFIFGDAAAVFQECTIIARLPLKGQYNVLTASGRDDPDSMGGISIQNCSIVASEDLSRSNYSVDSYLGRPWKQFARTVYIESYIDGFIHPSGWVEMEGHTSHVETLWYGEYNNSGPGAKNDSRVQWKGYHKVMAFEDALSFTVLKFITGGEWLNSTGIPYQNGI